MILNKPKRKQDEDLLNQIRAKPCAVCGRRPVDPAHIKSRGSGGPDTVDNVVPLCRQHHSEQHQKGFAWMMRNYSLFYFEMRNLGWSVIERFGEERLHHPRLMP